MKKWILILLFISIDISIANEVSVNSKISTNEALIGDHVSLTLTAISDNKIDIIFPKNKDSLTKLEVLDIDIDTIITEQFFKINKVYKLIGFEPGDYELGPFNIVFDKKGSDIGSFISKNTEIHKIKIKRIEIDDSASIKDIKALKEIKPFKDIKPIKDVELDIEEMLNVLDLLDYLIILIILILLIILIIWILRKLKNRNKKEKIDIPEKFDPKIPADILALEALKNLKKKQVWQESNYKEYYSQLTDILRIYIHRVFRIDAMEMTTDEIIDRLSKKVDESSLNELTTILSNADMVKFAKKIPSSSDCEMNFDGSVSFINSTKALIKTDREDYDV